MFQMQVRRKEPFTLALAEEKQGAWLRNTGIPQRIYQAKDEKHFKTEPGCHASFWEMSDQDQEKRKAYRAVEDLHPREAC